MVAPEFDAPMYEPLRDYGQIWLMPGVGTILAIGLGAGAFGIGGAVAGAATGGAL